MKRIVSTTLLVAALSLVALPATGCALIDRIGGTSTQLKTVTDTKNYFHFKIPGDWQADTSQGFILVYASEELPTEGAPFDKLALSAFSEAAVTDESLADELKGIVDRRAENRTWGEYTAGEVQDVEIGGRPGAKIRVNGTDSEGKKFDGDFYLVRTNGKSIGLMAVAPEGTLDDYAEDIDSILVDNWFWHFADPGASDEAPSPDSDAEETE
jgi:hypothetical protein